MVTRFGHFDRPQFEKWQTASGGPIMIQLNCQMIGPTFAPRWVIRTSSGLFWNGASWSPAPEEALLFHVSDEAESVASDLMKAHFESLSAWKYTTEIEVEVFGFIKPRLEDLRNHLWRNLVPPLDFDDIGPEGSIVLSIVDWDDLKEDC
jgi:hypothetical protein